MSMNRIRYFVTVADEEHLHRAAERLHLAPSALSRQIKALEFELGVQLFDRRSRGISLTQQGQIFKAEAVQLLRSYDRAAIEVQRAARETPGSLNIGVNEVVANNHEFSELFAGFGEKNPDVDVRFNFTTSIEQTELLHNSQIDIGFIYRFPRRNKIFDYKNIRNDRYCVLLNQSHFLSRKSEVSFSDLNREKFFCVTAARYSNLWDVSFGRMISWGIVPIIAQELKTHHEMVKLVSWRFGSGFIHSSYDTSDFPNVIAKPVVEIGGEFSLDAVWRRDNPSEALKLFRDFLVARFSTP